MLHAAAVVVAMLLCRDDCIQALGRQESLAFAMQAKIPSHRVLSRKLFEMLASHVQGSSLSLFSASMQTRQTRPLPPLTIWLHICATIKSLYFAAQQEMQGQPSPHCAR